MGFFTSPLNEEVMHTKGGKREMKKVLLIIGLFLITSLSWGMLSIEEAMQAIREFEGIPDLKLKYERLTNEYSDPWGGEPIPNTKIAPVTWPCYVFTTDYADGSYDRVYIVEPFSGKVMDWQDTKAIKNEPVLASVKDWPPPSWIADIAINFIRNKFLPDFDPAEYKIYIKYLSHIDSAATFNWLEYNPTNPQQSWPADADWPSDFPPPLSGFTVIKFVHYVTDDTGDKIHSVNSYFAIWVGFTSGKVLSFQYRHYPVNISLTPDISLEEARQIVLNYCVQMSQADYAEITQESKGIVFNGKLPPDHLSYVYKFSIRIYRNDPEYGLLFSGSGIFYVDAHTGEVWLVDNTLGGSGKTPTKEQVQEFKQKIKTFKKGRLSWKIFINQTREFALFPVEDRGKFYLSAPDAWNFGVIVEEDKGKVIIRYSGKSRELERANVLIKDGKIYVPLNAVLEIAGYEAKYGQKEKAIYIHKKGEKKEKAEGISAGMLSLSALSYVLCKFLRILA